jgi:hypothetical protein
MRERRAVVDGPRAEARLVELLHEHASRTNAIANDTLARAKAAIRLDL